MAQGNQLMERSLMTSDIAANTEKFFYYHYFGLRELPFRNIPDTDYYFGKTILCRQFLNTLDDSYTGVYIPNPYQNPAALMHAIGDELRDACEACTNLVLCFDEAQGMTLETLEAIRLISNLETEKSRLIYIILIGQPELDAKLDEAFLRQLKQRIAFSCTLQPLTRDELEQYIAHRLAIAGYNGPPLFSAKTLQMIFKASLGTPRLVNILAHKAMMAAFGEGVQTIKGAHVKAAIRDTESIRAPGGLVRSPFLFGSLGRQRAA